MCFTVLILLVQLRGWLRGEAWSHQHGGGAVKHPIIFLSTITAFVVLTRPSTFTQVLHDALECGTLPAILLYMGVAVDYVIKRVSPFPLPLGVDKSEVRMSMR
jgi:hypothetical protein